MPKVSGASPVNISKKALMIRAGAICQQKRIKATLIRSMNHNPGRKRSISQITRQAGKAGTLFVNVDSVIVNFLGWWFVLGRRFETTNFQDILCLHVGLA